MEDKVKELLSPHFGYLPLFMKWSKEVSFKKLEEIHVYLGTHKNSIKQLPKPLSTYNYYDALSELLKIDTTLKLKKTFKDGLNGKSRRFFEKTFEEKREKYEELIDNEIKLKLFFRTSSKPQTMEEYDKYLDKVLSYNDSSEQVISRIEDEFDYLRTSDGGYLFKLEKDMLDMVPPSWCIHNSVTEYEREIRDRELNSIWILVNPFTSDETRMMVGIDANKDLNTLLYMDTTNNRFKDDVPIDKKEFYHITRSRLDDTDAKRKKELQKILNDQMAIVMREREGMESQEKDSYIWDLLNGRN